MRKITHVYFRTYGPRNGGREQEWQLFEAGLEALEKVQVEAGLEAVKIQA